MNIKPLIAKLHNLERQVLPVLDRHHQLSDIIKATGLKEIQVMRALQWLQNKKIVELSSESKEFIDLDINGIQYLKKGLPERRLLEALRKGELTIKQATDKAKLTKEELNFCLGILRQKAAIFITKHKELVIKLLDQGKKLLEKEMFEETFLKKEFPVDLMTLKPEEKLAFENLIKRKKVIKLDEKKIKTSQLTEIGKQILESGIEITDIMDRLTPEMLKTGKWKEKKFRPYDVSINVPELNFGKKQHYKAFLDEVRQKFLSLGFTEMTGPLVETDFWDMDALYMPQFHSARDIHEAYYIKEPEYRELDEKLVNRVRQAHENGFNTGSKGWNYIFDTKRTQRLLLRTQGTACSARMLNSKNLKIPGKYFGINRCFRYDIIDATHQSDFTQIEGIVVEPGLNIRHLFGLLKMIAKEFANADEVKIVPGYFPFTEPSAELFAKHPDLGWIELGGAGIFRPEMTKPLGIDVPVIAWGLGIDRIAMFKLGIKDIRQLYSQDLEFLRKIKLP